MQIFRKIENYFDSILKRPILVLVIIISIGVFFRVYFTNWNIPSEAPDSFVFLIEGLGYASGDFSYFSTRFLWPGLLSIFFVFFHFDGNLGYFNLMRIITIVISVVSVPLVYHISKHYVDKKYAIFASAIFAFDPNIIENSLFLITEPLFILCGLLSVYFLIQKNNKLIILSFFFAGLSFDTRLNGIVIILLVLIFCVLKIRKKEISIKLFVLGCCILIFVTIPYIYLPLELGKASVLDYFTNSIEIISSNHVQSATYSSNFQTNSSVLQVSIIRELIHLVRISVPYLIFFVPIGVIVSLKNFDINKKILFSAIIISLIIAIPQYLMSAEYRNLLFIIPIFCILSSIGIQRIFYNKKHYNLFIVFILIGLVLVSFGFLTIHLDKDIILVEEREKFGKFVVNNFSGRIIGGPYNELSHNVPNAKFGTVEEGNIHNDKIGIVVTYEPIDSNEKLKSIISNLKIDYVIVDSERNNRYPILQDVFENESGYLYLQKVFDSEEHEYKKYRVKIFKINYYILDN